ncbi:Uncharacterised protein [Vibrio cholerae]|nr:Uncharacterised protein [Vibrio cholerae]
MVSSLRANAGAETLVAAAITAAASAVFLILASIAVPY